MIEPSKDPLELKTDLYPNHVPNILDNIEIADRINHILNLMDNYTERDFYQELENLAEEIEQSLPPIIRPTIKEDSNIWDVYISIIYISKIMITN